MLVILLALQFPTCFDVLQEERYHLRHLLLINSIKLTSNIPDLHILAFSYETKRSLL